MPEMGLRGLQPELAAYETAFTLFVNEHNLPSEFFEQPDHFAIKCADEAAYVRMGEGLKDDVDNEGIWQIRLDERFLGSAHLAAKVALAGAEFAWIEIMQPRPGKEAPDSFVEHTEFYFPDFARAQAVLTENGVAYELQENPGHAWINIVIDEKGREIKLNNKPLAEVVVWEREQGHLHKMEQG